jgi:hypothetical protein
MDYNYSEIEFLDRIFGTLYPTTTRPNNKAPPSAAAAAAAAAADVAAVPNGEPGLRPATAGTTTAQHVAPRFRKRPRSSSSGGDCGNGGVGGTNSNDETRAPPERPVEEEALRPRVGGGGVGGSEDMVDVPMRAPKAAQSPPRATDCPRPGEAGGTGLGGGEMRMGRGSGATETRKAQPYS